MRGTGPLCGHGKRALVVGFLSSVPPVLIHMGEVGEEMVDVFKALLGADGVVKSCF